MTQKFVRSHIGTLNIKVSQHFVITVGVAMLHLCGLWALQAGLKHRTVAAIKPAEILITFVEPASESPPTPSKPTQLKNTLTQAQAPVKKWVTHQPLAVVADQPTTATETPTAPPAPAAVVQNFAVKTTPTTPASGSTLTPAPVPLAAKIDMPSSNADYLQNPKPPYPALSKRLGEQGKVVVHVLIGVDGNAEKADIKVSSGFDRLDQAAIATVLRWRYVPGKRSGIPEAMWFNVPINFVLE